MCGVYWLGIRVQHMGRAGAGVTSHGGVGEHSELTWKIKEIVGILFSVNLSLVRKL